MKPALRTKLKQLDPSILSRLEPVGFDSNRKRRALPPLQTLVAFEAAARLQSFTRAAVELNLTQPAVSQQIKLLEARLGTELFTRSNNQIMLTERGDQFAEAVGGLLDSLAESVQDLAPDEGRVAMTISLLPSFASTWFATRAHRFLAQNPQIDLITLSTVAMTGFGQEDADVAIRWGPGGATGVYEERLFGEQHKLVASARIAQKVAQITEVNELAAFPFFHDTNHSEWREVISTNGGDARLFEEGAYFGDASATLNAIVHGGGVGVVRDVIARHLLENGTLVELPFASAKGPFSYFFLCPESRLAQPRVQAMLRWLRQEATSA